MFANCTGTKIIKWSWKEYNLKSIIVIRNVAIKLDYQTINPPFVIFSSKIPSKSPPFYKKLVEIGGFLQAVQSTHTPFLEVSALQVY